ncbi:MAG: glycosyl hydrolase, repeat-containing protein [Frankiales bacterium]|nr:glycosyl hydrolase, repeat-containing protein [Frankiales bacterium]
MKRALCLLVLVAACSHGTNRAAPTPTPTDSPTPAVTSAPTVTPTSPGSSPTPRPFEGPKGTTVPSGFRPMSATFISDQTGYVLGASPCPGGKGSCDVIARTQDGGRTWKAIPSPKTSPDHLAQIRMADERNGFVTGDDAWVTHDGGGTWKVTPSGASVTVISIAAGRAWALGDSGALLSADVTTGGFASERGVLHLNTISAHGAEVIYGSANAPTISTLEHGEAPASHRQPCGSSGVAVPVEGTATHWFVVCEGDAGLGHQEKHAFQSTDAGTTWKPAGDPPQSTGTDPYVTTDGVFVFDHQQVAVYRGGTWSTALQTDGGISEGGFESARLGYCIGGFGDTTSSTMKLTHDAGRTWKTVAF